MVVADPYRWLEADGDPEVVDWVTTQNERTAAHLQSLPTRAGLHADLVRLLRAGSSVAPSVAGANLFTLERWGDRDQAALVVRPAVRRGAARTLVDPQQLTEDRTGAIDWYHPSDDGRLVAFGVSTGGDERSTLRVLDVATGELLDDRIPHTRAASVAWEPDGSGFLYTRYPDPATTPPAEQGYRRWVYGHRLGQPWRRDELVWDRLPDDTAWATVELSRDGRWLLVHLAVGWSRTDVHLVDRSTGARTVLVEGIDALSSFTVTRDRIVGLTTLGADHGRVVAAPLPSAWKERWETVVPEGEPVLEAVAPTPRSLLVLSTVDAAARLDRYGHDGAGHRRIHLPGPGSVAGLTASRDRDEAFVSFTSFALPPATLRWATDGTEGAEGAEGTERTDGTAHEGTRLEGAPAATAPDEPDGALVEWSRLDGGSHGPRGDYVVEQVEYPSSDGTLVPMFLVRAEGTEPTPGTFCVLTGYGGFSVAMTPTYSAAVVEVCDRGGLYAVANIRGGSERGEAWHRAGMGAAKQQSFDDFLAAADWLVAQGLTSRDRLAIRGGSNGGLLVGAAVTQRPDLCRAAQAAVPLLDMVRYPEYLIARLWIPEYGDPDDPDEFAWLWGYSPYHRVIDGTAYPAVLLTSAADDSRVHPMHARKMAARLQAATADPVGRPVLLREEGRAGHGAGKPVSAQADELADVLAFLFDQLGVTDGDDGDDVTDGDDVADVTDGDGVTDEAHEGDGGGASPTDLPDRRPARG